MATDPFEKFPPHPSTSAEPVSADKQSSPGAMLRVAREAAGLSVGDVATRLRMGVRQVDALERADYSALPTGTFLRGMVRNYAKLVHVDADAAIRVLEGTHTHAAVSLKDATIIVPSHNIKLGGGRNQLASPKARIAIAGVVLMLLGVAGWYWWQYVRPNLSSGGRPVTLPVASKPTPEAQSSTVATLPTLQPISPSPSPSPTTDVQTLQPTISTPRVEPAATVLLPVPAPSVAAPTVAAVAPPTASVVVAPPALIENTNIAAKESTNLKPDPNAVARPAGSSVLVFSFAGESWVEVVDGRGKALISRRFQAGENGEAIGRAPFSIVVGNASQVKMAYNGKDFDLTPHTRVAVARVTLK